MKTIFLDPKRECFFIIRVIVVMLLFPFSSKAQYTLKGKVVNASENVIHGDVLLLNAENNTLIKADTLRNGTFTFQEVTETKAIVSLFIPGFADTNIVVDNSDQKALVDLNTIQLLRIKQLDEIIIQAKKPVFERTTEGTRINVENTLLAASVNAAELLGKTPGIVVTGNKVNFFGKGEAMIILHGKEIPYETFKSLPPQEIKAIELITEPGVKYDAKGKAVILVHMKQGYHQGIEATITENGTLGLVKNEIIGKYFMNSGNVNLNFRKDKLNITGYYANDLGTTWNKNVFSTKIQSSSGEYETFGTYKEDARSKSVHSYRFGALYDLNPKSNLSFQYDGLSNYFGLDVSQNSDYYSPAKDVNLIRMRNKATTRLTNHSFNLNYSLNQDPAGKNSLFAGAQYNHFENVLFDNITETITVMNNPAYTWYRVNSGKNVIDLYTLQADVTRKSKNITTEAGVKFSHSINQGKIRFYTKALGFNDYQENPMMANGNLYTETIPGAYLNFKAKKNKWNLSAGLRMEYSMVKGYSEKLQKNIIDSAYFNLFPAAKVLYKANDKWTSSLSYARKINRPLYQDMDPFLWYLDSLTSIQGNPRLIPELLDQCEWNLGFKQFNLRTSYTQSHNTIWAVTKPGNNGDNSVVYTKANIQRRDILTVALDVPYERKNYSGFSTIAYNFYKFTDSRVEYKVHSTSPQFYLYSYHQFIFPKLFAIDITGEYYGPSSDGFTRKKPYYYITLGLARSFYKEQLSVQLVFNDILRSARWKGQRNIGGYNNTYDQRITSHYVRLSITIRLGVLRNFKYTNKTINDKEFNRIKQ